jgi:hypothetical protein
LRRGDTIRCRVLLPGGENESDDCGGADDGQPAAARLRADRRLTITRASVVALLAAVVVCAAGCRREDVAAAKSAPQMIWRAVGSWSGHGNRQTESFTSDTGALRVKWETAAPAGAPAGVFRLTAHSAISGRVLQEVVDERGAGSGVDYVSQDPHVFYMSVESADLDWKFSVEEGIAGEVVGTSR